MWGAVVDEDDDGGQGEGAADDLDGQDAAQREPDGDAGGLVRRGEGGVDDGEVWRQGVGEREEAEAVAEAPQRPESGVDGRVDEELEADADDAEDGHGESDAAGRHAQSACEAERQSLSCVRRWGRVLRVEAGRGEMDEPEVIEGADVEGQHRVAEKGAEDVAGPDAGPWQLSSRFWCLGG